LFPLGARAETDLADGLVDEQTLSEGLAGWVKAAENILDFQNPRRENLVHCRRA
jgi:hypothetical protein